MLTTLCLYTVLGLHDHVADNGYDGVTRVRLDLTAIPVNKLPSLGV